MYVKFSDPDNFLAEIQKDRGKADRNIVRMNIAVLRRENIPHFRRVYVLIQYSVDMLITELRHFVGEYSCFTSPESDHDRRERENVIKMARTELESWETKISELGYEIRGGLLDDSLPMISLAS